MPSQPIKNHFNAKGNLFSYLLILTLLFFVGEISFAIHFSGIYFGDYKEVANHLKIPWRVIPGILYFFSAQVLIHLAYAILVWGLARGVGIALRCTWRTTESLGFYIWALGLVNLLLANHFAFPNSKFSIFTTVFIFPLLTKIIFLLLSIGSLIIVLLAIYGFFLLSTQNLLRKPSPSRGRWPTAGWGDKKNFSSSIFLSPHPAVGHLPPAEEGLLSKFCVNLSASSACMVIVFFFIAILFVNHTQHTEVTDASTSEKPNIILIGIDALRPDFLGYFGASQKTPHLDNLLNQSTVFAEALTPLARTFPAWVSILTGQYPKLNGIRSNLMDTSHTNLSQTLPAILKTHGYETLFGTDETRFSNIDERFGFDKIIAPPTGFNDFLLGSLNDFPLSNLLVNTVIGRYLFPNSYANRPVYTTYDPNAFLNLLEPTLSTPRTKPLFLAVHFCLPHFPYFWGKAAAEGQSLANYQAAVERVDQQVGNFLERLAKNNILTHSIIVLLSDHGEAIELPGDRVTEADLFIPGKNNPRAIVPHFYPPSFDFESVNQTAGHGTDVLGIPQYHVVLAFKREGVSCQHAFTEVSTQNLLRKPSPSRGRPAKQVLCRYLSKSMLA